MNMDNKSNNRITNFRFNDIVLYSKGWYEPTENILNDLGYLFSKVYGWNATEVYKNKETIEEEIARMMIKAIDYLYELKGIKFDTNFNGRWSNSFTSFMGEINKRMRLNNTLTFNMACIQWAMFIFSQLADDEIKLNPPHYDKHEHFRKGMMFGKHPISMTYTEMNRIAQEAFKN